MKNRKNFGKQAEISVPEYKVDKVIVGIRS